MERRQQQPRLFVAGIALTANGVSLYFSLKNDPATKAIADDTEHQLLPKGLASISPMAGLTMNAMVFKHSPYPNAAKAFLQFMLEKEQYEPWLNANSGYWAQPLATYADAAVWSGDPKVRLFKNTMASHTTMATRARSRRRPARSMPTTCWCRCALRLRPTRRRRKPPPPKPNAAPSDISAGQKSTVIPERPQSVIPERCDHQPASDSAFAFVRPGMTDIRTDKFNVRNDDPFANAAQRQPNWFARLFDYKPFLIVVCLTPAIGLLWSS